MNFLSGKRIYNVKKKIGQLQNKNKKIKTTVTTALKNGLKYSPMSEGNASIAEPKLEVLPLR